jgi:radical SAM superfamily enzyme YgiQ (UPF0313 family)
LKILFLEIDTESTWGVASIGPGFIGAYICKYGHEADLLRISEGWAPMDIVAHIRKEDPDMLALSLTTRQWTRARHVVRKIRNHLDIPVIAGGHHPTFEPESVLAAGGFDYVCLGEGEHAVLELLTLLEKGKQVEPDQIPNIWVRGGQRPILRPIVTPLDSLPYMARSLLGEKHGVVHMITQRGCPFTCPHCAARTFQDFYPGNNYNRRRTVRNVIEELIQLQLHGSLNYVIFLDDTFTIHEDWVSEFCEVYKKEVKVGFSINARVDTVSASKLQALAVAGCKHIIYGVESGSYRVRRDILKRPIKNQRIIEVFQWTQDNGMLATANYMLGLPGETKADIEATLDLNLKLQPDDFSYFVFYPYPGTHLFNVCRKKGYLPGKYLELPANNRQSILTLPDITQNDIRDFYDRFTVAREITYLGKYVHGHGENQKSYAKQHIKNSADTG